MKKTLLLFVLITFSLVSNSQIIFEKGYYINNSNEKIDCLIKNIDWKNNPIKFICKLNEEAEQKEVTVGTVKEFGIYNISKYVRFNINIDRSSKSLNQLSNVREPIFKRELLFLKVLVEGKANLYLYKDGILKRFFYNTDTTNVKQLVYKRYKLSENTTGKNNDFRKQLWDELRFPALSMNKIKRLQYEKKELMKVFVEYNKSFNPNIVNHEAKQKRDFFNLNIRPRMNMNSLTIENDEIIDFGNKKSFGIGVETEFIFPFNKNKWSFAIEPSYQFFKSTNTIDTRNVSGGKLITNVNYKSIEVPFSLRYYLFLNEKSKAFVNASVIVDKNFDSYIGFSRIDGSLLYNIDIDARRNYAMGVGYKYNNKYSLEVRYQTSRELLGYYLFWESNYNTLSIILGYSLF